MKNIFIILAAASLLTACNRPVAKFTYEKKDAKAPASVVFQNESKKATSFLWKFGDGTQSTDSMPSHVYKSSGNFTVSLIAKKGEKSSIVEKNIQIKAPEKCLVEIQTPYGNMLVQLYDATPEHRDNFVKLAEEGFFDGLLFHRVINGFMIQGGDPQSKDAAPGQPLGSGGPGYTIPAEFVDSLIHLKGALAAARTGDAVNPEKRSSGSQFYIVQGRKMTDDQLSAMEASKGIRYSKEQRKLYKELGGTPFLDQQYTVFGRVIKGLDVIDKIAAVETKSGDRPVEDVKMKIQVIK